MNPIPSPVTADGMVFLMSGFRGNSLKAVKLAEAKGDITGTPALAWTLDRDTPYVPSPLLYDNVLYFLKGEYRRAVGRSTRRRASRTTRCSGSKGSRTSSRRRSAPTGKIYMLGQDGATAVIKHGATYRGAGHEQAGRQVRRVAGAGRQRDVPAGIPVPLLRGGQ